MSQGALSTTPRRSPSAGCLLLGFTLIEMLVVIMLISLLVGSSLVSVHGRRDDVALKMSVRDLSATVRFAAEHSLRERRPFRIAFAEGLETYRVEVMSPATGNYHPAEGLAGQAHSVAEGVFVVGIEADGEARDGGTTGAGAAKVSTCIQFRPDGNGFAGIVRLRNRSGRRATLRVAPYSGQTDVTME
jgi:prepilin-type N-terminal cleavage/methylation domain-containing protein